MIRRPFKEYVCSDSMKAHPEHVKIVNGIYDKYHPRKKQFINNIKGTGQHLESSVMKGVSPDDAVELMASLSKLILKGLYVKRHGRGHRQGVANYCSELPVRFAETFAIYVYRRYNRP